jgi:large subunit ribosomal protein L15
MSLTHLFTDHKLKKAKRVGRGISAGQGKTAGRGTKGQKSRTGSGRKISAWFEGGQTPLFRKLAKKRGFTKHTAKRPAVVTTTVINKFFAAGEAVNPATLVEKKILRKSDLGNGVKVILGEPLKVGITIDAIKTSKAVAAR